MANLSYLTANKPKEVAAYTLVQNTVGAYKPIANTVKAYTPGTYQSKYTDQLNDAFNTVTNWKYDPMQDASYQALAKVYGARGNIAAKNTLADAAALNGGLQTSYAVSAAQQARNQYNQELAAYIPQLEQAAYGRASDLLANLRQADDTDYGRFRDTEGDRQWKYTQDYQAWRDREADNQWAYNQKYNQYRDAVADSQWLYGQNYQKYRDLMSDYEWATNYNMDVYQQLYNEAQAAKAKSGGGGGGGGRRSSGSSSSSYNPYSYPSTSSDNDSVVPDTSIYKQTADAVADAFKKYKNSTAGSAMNKSRATMTTK